MGKLAAFDARLIELTQEAYLWLWDRTGVFVATLFFAAYVGDHALWGSLTWFDFLLLAIFGALSAHRYLAQSTDLRWLNAHQRAWRDLGPRPYFTIIVIVFLAKDLLQLNAWHFASDCMSLLWSYLGCVQVRDREPKDFFAFRKLAGAGA